MPVAALVWRAASRVATRDNMSRSAKGGWVVARYGPEDTWPKHDKPFWNDALAVAREAGWSLVWLDAPHWWGRVECPTGEHTGLVDKTARGGETKANELKKDVRGCPHGTGGTGSKVRERESRCRDLLDQAEGLLDRAAEALLRVEGREEAFDQLALLEAAQADVADAAASVEELLGSRSFAEAIDAAWERAATYDDAPPPAAIADDLDTAEAVAVEAHTMAAKIKRSGLSDPLRKRAEEAKARVTSLRARLNEVQERTGPADG